MESGPQAEDPGFRALAEAAPWPVVVLDANGVVTWANRAAAQRYPVGSTVSAQARPGLQGSAPPGAGTPDGHEAEIRRLKETAEFRARFLNIAAHELKTPLTPIRMQLQILRSHLADADPKAQKSLAILGRSVERLQTLMQDVLDAARVQADRLKLRDQVLSLTEVVAEAGENYRAVAQSLGITLDAQLEDGVNVRGDPERLLQVVNNLLSNAMKFTHAGGTVTLRVRREDGMAAIIVRDTGRGMDASQISRLFEPFSQVHPDVEATQKGTGLGLYITKAIVAQHRGTIEVTSPGPEQGTRVMVRIPLSGEAPTPVTKPARPSGLRQRLREMI